MPSIEIRGLNQTSARELGHRLFAKVFFEKPYYFDLVVEIIPTNVIDGLLNDRPYLYLAYTDEDCEFIAEIKQLLSELGDVQVVKLVEFIPDKRRLTQQEVFAEIWRRPLGSCAKTLALALYGRESNPWLRKVLRELVREGAIVKVSDSKGTMYKPSADGFRIFLKNHIKACPQTPSSS